MGRRATFKIRKPTDQISAGPRVSIEFADTQLPSPPLGESGRGSSTGKNTSKRQLFSRPPGFLPQALETPSIKAAFQARLLREFRKIGFSSLGCFAPAQPASWISRGENRCMNGRLKLRNTLSEVHKPFAITRRNSEFSDCQSPFFSDR